MIKMLPPEIDTRNMLQSTLLMIFISLGSVYDNIVET